LQPLEIQQQFLATLTDDEACALQFDWRFWAREQQLPPERDWTYWLILAGRGFGKTRSGAEMVRNWSQKFRFVNLIGATVDDARDIMIEGESGILAICPKDERPVYRKSDRCLLWPTGAKSLIFTADEPDRLRGKQHEKLWADELCAWRYAGESWDQAMFGLRLGAKPQAIVTTTPRPIKQLLELMADPNTHITRGTTYDNRANLAREFFTKITGKYEGTRLGRQELNAEVLTDIPGALWQRDRIEELRVRRAPELIRIVIGVDPAVSSNEDSNETGIIAAGIDKNGVGYVLDDKSLIASPAGWGGAVVDLYYNLSADRIIGEMNQGGEMVENTIRTIRDKADQPIGQNVSYKGVHASKGKHTRAEPVSALYEQGKVHHVGGFPYLEDQLCTWLPGEDSPDRLDALVWALTELMIEGGGTWEDVKDLGHVNGYSPRWK
jgi:phage terminase large subunit-like protein